MTVAELEALVAELRKELDELRARLVALETETKWDPKRDPARC